MFGDDVRARTDYSGADASAARSAARSAQTELRHIDDRLSRLTLVNLALWSLLQDKTGLTEADLLAHVKLLDEMDGKADGKAQGPKVMPCGSCGRPMKTRVNKCPYCGKPRRVASAFDMV